MARFVVLRHERPEGEHYDLMLEASGVLKTWAIGRTPEAGVEMACEALPDHRLAYLDYEGPISGGRGSVSRWDRGTFRIEQQSETQWTVALQGEKLVGQMTLRRLAPDSSGWMATLFSG